MAVMILALLALLSLLAAGVLLGALTSAQGIPVAVSAGIAGVVVVILPIIAAFRTTKMMPNSRRPLVTLGTVLLINGVIAGGLIGGLPGPTAAAMGAHGDWFLPESTPESVRTAYVGLLPAAETPPETSGEELVAEDPIAEEPVAEEPVTEPVVEDEPPAGPMTASALFATRADTVVVIKVQAPLQDDSPFSEMMEKMGIDVQEGFGSGFLVSADGLFITNHHVLGTATRAEVSLRDGRTFSGIEVLASDATNDLVLARIDATDLLVAPLATDRAVVGETAYAIGSPLGLEYTLTQGIISAHRTMQGTDFLQMQTDIAPGSSGGPLFNDRGEVMGVNTATRTAGLNLAVDIHYVQELLQAEQTPKLLEDYVPGLQVAAMTVEGAALNPVMREGIEQLFLLLGRQVGSCTESLPADGASLNVHLGDRSFSGDLSDDAKACLENNIMTPLLFMQLQPSLFSSEEGQITAKVQGYDVADSEQTGSLTLTFLPGSQPEAVAEDPAELE